MGQKINSKLFRLSKSANLDLEIDIVDTLPHLSDKDEYVINELERESGWGVRQDKYDEYSIFLINIYS